MEYNSVLISLEQAREWYQKGGDWRKLALSAFKEDKLKMASYLEIVEKEAPTRRELPTKVVDEKRVEMRVLIMLHNLAKIFNKKWEPKEGAEKYFIQIKRVSRAEAEKLGWCGAKIGQLRLSISKHSSVMYPGIPYFATLDSAKKALDILHSELKEAYKTDC